ncbi:hypothetical protein HWV62_5973 [Athelia sp. TMB]|nr:hypothetical protein HWV62_5973 [Athelia sp. TMB]
MTSVMGGVNASPRYVETMGIGKADGTVTNTTHQGGIYYLGAIVGCFAGGWAADRIGRVNGIFIGALFATIGGALQAAAQSSNFILVARVVTGLGTGALTGITPVFVSEISSTSRRGGWLGLVFIANYLGISIAYWLSFGLSFIDGGLSDIRWRFLLAFQCIPAIALFLGIRMLPDSPRYLASVGRNDEALEVLTLVRGGSLTQEVEKEYAEILEASKHARKSSPIEFLRILLGRANGSGVNERHLGRRAWLCIWLQIMASWTGITAVTAYSPVLLSQAGYSSIKQNGLAGGLNTIGIVGTIISAYVVDRFGRRRCLMTGSFGLFVVNLLAASIFEGSRLHPEKAASFAPAAVAMLFLFNLTYAATWGTVAFLLPTEIFPSEMRAQGNGFGITGWAIGVGWTVLVNPIMFAALKSRTYFLFAGLNLLWIPIVYLLYPETANRSLETIGALFIPSNPLNSAAERSYAENGRALVDAGLNEKASIVESV